MKKWDIVVRTRDDVSPQEMVEALDGWDVIYIEEILKEE